MDRQEAIQIARAILANNNPRERRRMARKLAAGARVSMSEAGRVRDAYYAPDHSGELSAYGTRSTCVWRWLVWASAVEPLPELRKEIEGYFKK